MPRGFVAPKELLDKKAPHGKPCTRCGLCCLATTCILGRHLFHTDGRCPAVCFDKDGSRCGVVDNVQSVELADAARVLIGTKLGCDARFNGEPPDEGFYLSLRHWDHLNFELVENAMRLWGIK